MTRRRLRLEPAVAALTALAAAAGVALLAGCAGGDPEAAPSADTGGATVAEGGLERCAGLADDPTG